jgi:hypothetical protein
LTPLNQPFSERPVETLSSVAAPIPTWQSFSPLKMIDIPFSSPFAEHKRRVHQQLRRKEKSDA